MVWIKVRENCYLNADSIKSFYVYSDSMCKDGASIVYHGASILGEDDCETNILWSQTFERQLDPNCYHFGLTEPIGLSNPNAEEEYDPLYNFKMHQKITDFTNALLPAFLTELEKAKKNGDTFFDLPKFVDSFEFKE